MARRYRRKQDDTALAALVTIGLAGIAVTATQAQQGLLIVLIIATALALGVVTFIAINERRKRQRLARSGIQEVDAMTGLDFEKYLQALLIKRGYTRVTLTTTYDLGVDLIARKGGERWAIQAKRYHGKVGLDAVRQVVAAANHYKCDRTMVITNSYFTHNARVIAQSTNCELVDRAKLIDIMLDERAQPSIQ